MPNPHPAFVSSQSGLKPGRSRNTRTGPVALAFGRFHIAHEMAESLEPGRCRTAPTSVVACAPGRSRVASKPVVACAPDRSRVASKPVVACTPDRSRVAGKLAVGLVLAGALVLAGCAAPTGSGSAGSPSFNAASALDQLPGIALAVTSIVKTSPAGATDTGKAVAGWADSVAAFATDMKAGLASKDQLAGAYIALRNTAANLPLDSRALAAMSPYLAWGDVAAQVLNLALNVVNGAPAQAVPAANPSQAQ